MRAAVVVSGLLLASAVTAGAVGAPRNSSSPSAPAAEVGFDRDIRPILSENCFKCHGPDPGARQAGLRLDRREDLFAKRPEGAPVVAGNPQRSLIWLRIAADGARRMPPLGSGKHLTRRQKELVRRWIEHGAATAQHWAFVPPRLPAVPKLPSVWRYVRVGVTVSGYTPGPVSGGLQLTRTRTLPPSPRAWVRNPIDAFILQRLLKAGMMPSVEADRITLIRRLSLDLTGLPPTPEEVDAFLADRRPDAYERQVERLLSSPHYGERWGRHWLDAARYADSDGFEKDKQRWVWAYRDWVISALNRDLPYDQFIIEQIAGDLLRDESGRVDERTNGRADSATAPTLDVHSPTRPLVHSSPQDRLVATGFLRNSMVNEEGGVDPEQFRMEAMFDRMDAICKGVLGLTIQCAQCHSHKYDPLTQVEYYRLFAFLNNCDEGNVAVYTPADQMRRAEILRRIQEIEARLRHERPDWPQRLAEWEAQAVAAQPEWRIVRPELDASGGQKHTLLDDGSILAAGYAPTKHTTDFTVRVDGGPVTAARLEHLNDPNLPRGGPGRSIFGLCALTEFRVEVAPADNPTARQAVKIASAAADVNPAEKELDPIFDDRSKKRRVTGPVGYAIDGKDDTAWGLDVGPGRSNVPRQSVFVFEKPVAYPQGAILTFHLVQNHGGWNSDDNQNLNLGRFRFSVTGAQAPAAGLLPAATQAAIDVPSVQRSPAQAAALFSAWRATVPEWSAANEAIEQLWREHPQPSTQLVLLERETPRSTHVLDRGDFLKPTERVEPGVPDFLHALPSGAPLNRLTFAYWLVDQRSPTTARALVNRVWQTYFETGIVRTSEDLGLQSEAPSHPELLDWLAWSFVRGSMDVWKYGRADGRTNGRSDAVAAGPAPSTRPHVQTPTHSPARPWSLKALHRLIVTSATYRQSSSWYPRWVAQRPESGPTNPVSVDPENRLLWRGARFRMEGEIVRDIALAASGLLNTKVGGPSVFPPAPEFLFQPPASYGPKQWPLSTGEDRFRRALYTFRYRSVPYPALQAFDTPPGEQSCVRRVRSNTPVQALTTQNEPLFVECARALALKAIQEGGTGDGERLTYAFRRCVARTPRAEESRTLLELLERQEERFAGGKPDPWALIAGDVKERPTLPEGVTAARHAAWISVARVLLNLDETITRE